MTDRPFRDEPTEVLEAALDLANTHADQAARFRPQQPDDALPAVARLFQAELQQREAQTLPPPQGPEYAPCRVCSHIEPEHEPNAGSCLVCDCAAYQVVEPSGWVDGDPLMEAVAHAVWEQCRTEGTSLIVDDPRNIAAVAASVTRAAVRAETLRDVEEICDEAGAVYTSKALNGEATGAYELMERFRRKAEEAEQTGAPDYEATTGHLITCLAVPGGASDPQCHACQPAPAALRARIVAEVQRLHDTGAVYALDAGEPEQIADAVLAVLFGPIPAGSDVATWTAIRAIQLMNEAGRQRDEALAVLPEPTDRAAEWHAAADALEAYIDRYRSPSIANWTGAVAFLRDRAIEAHGTGTQQQCPGIETVPNRCTCVCEGCKHHCGAHNPAATQQQCPEREPLIGVQCSKQAGHEAHSDRPGRIWYPVCDDEEAQQQPDTEARCSCGGTFPLNHLHADTHEPAPVAQQPAAEETDEERADREATERDHARGDHTYCGITCETEMPTEHLRNFVIAKGYPGTRGALDELLRRARAEVAEQQAAAEAEQDDTVHSCPGRWGGPNCRCFDAEPAPAEQQAAAADGEETQEADRG